MRTGPKGRATAALIALAFAAAACGRPTGDFGRARPSVVHDELLPGTVRAVKETTLFWRTYAGFDLTEDEKELRNRAWAFVRPPHMGAWWLESIVEGQRVGFLPALDPWFDPGRYHTWLRGADYASQNARWNKVIEDIQGDALLVPPFCAIAQAVRRSDAERLAAADRLQPPDETLALEALNRVDENAETMAWVLRALGYRLAAYRNAIDRLEVEAPSAMVWEANRAYALLAGSQCQDAPALVQLDLDGAHRSRIMDGPDPFDQPVLQK